MCTEIPHALGEGEKGRAGGGGGCRLKMERALGRCLSR